LPASLFGRDRFKAGDPIATIHANA
jgi:hypothetical protein